MKYIIYKEEDGTTEFVCFNNKVRHDYMAQTMGIKKKDQISAGILMLIDGIVFANGQSDTLDLKSRPEDAEVIANLLRR